ncbi:hypothetical protein D9M71_823250 [compost metagenome]
MAAMVAPSGGAWVGAEAAAANSKASADMNPPVSDRMGTAHETVAPHYAIIGLAGADSGT